MERDQTLSIILPVYNARETVAESIESVLAVKNVPLDLVVVDDGSTDGTGSIIERYAKEHSCIRLIRQENAGPGAARNTGLRNADGAYLGFLDADDRYVPEALKKAWCTLSEGKADVVCVGIKMVKKNDPDDEKGWILYQGDDTILSGREAFRRMLNGEGLDSNTYAKFYRREILPDDLMFFEGMLGDDIPVTYRMLLSADTVFMAKEIGYLYRMDEDGKSISGVGFAPYYFDMIDRAKELYELVLRDYPEYREEAAGFYLDLVLQCVERIFSLEDRKVYRDGLRGLLKELEIHREELKRSTRINKRRKMQLKLWLLSVKRAEVIGGI